MPWPTRPNGFEEIFALPTKGRGTPLSPRSRTPLASAGRSGALPGWTSDPVAPWPSSPSVAALLHGLPSGQAACRWPAMPAVLAERVATIAGPASGSRSPAASLGPGPAAHEPDSTALVRKLGAWPGQQQADLARRWPQPSTSTIRGLAAAINPLVRRHEMPASKTRVIHSAWASKHTASARLDGEESGQEAKPYGQAIARRRWSQPPILGLGLNATWASTNPRCPASQPVVA